MSEEGKDAKERRGRAVLKVRRERGDLKGRKVTMEQMVPKDLEELRVWLGPQDFQGTKGKKGNQDHKDVADPLERWGHVDLREGKESPDPRGLSVEGVFTSGGVEPLVLT